MSMAYTLTMTRQQSLYFTAVCLTLYSKDFFLDDDIIF